MTDTIAALSSGRTPSGVAVIRLSGPSAFSVGASLCGALPAPRRAQLRAIRDGDGALLDRGLVLVFPGPDSFTGEDCLELQVHGGPALVRRLLEVVTGYGVRLAAPGEFTRRAFGNGRLDLTEVEGLGDLIAAETEGQRRLAIARAEGGLARQLTDWRDRLLALRAEVEARLDFADEDDVSDQVPNPIMSGIGELAGELEDGAARWDNGRIRREGLRVVLAGVPNAGKSTLLNRLARSEVAIVTDVAGTTRDVLEVPIDLEGQLVLVSDTAGLRETDDPVEREGVRRARARMGEADLVLSLVAPEGEAPVLDGSAHVWRVATKSDRDWTRTVPVSHVISAKTGEGIESLLEDIADFAGSRAGNEEALPVSRLRDRQALEGAAAALWRIRADDPLELIAENLRVAGESLGRLAGTMDAEQVLDRLFAGFCIGK